MANLIGLTLKNRYRVEESIGRGGMADVYKVYDNLRASHLAIKVLREDLARDRIFLRRFQREAQTLSRLQHRHIVRFYGLEQDGMDVFMLMDFIDGESLRDVIFRANRPLDQNKMMEILKPVCSALHYAHQMGMLHCDIKPGNILLAANGEVLLTDFGIARLSDAATATLVGAGTPAYMAPELVKGEEPSPQTDIYALGVVLYEMLTGGERPFTGEKATVTGTTAEKVRWEQVNLPPVPPSQYNPKVPRALEAVALRCLQKDPARRYPSCLELMRALGEAVPGAKPVQREAARVASAQPKPGHRPEQTPPEPAPRPTRKKKKERKGLSVWVIPLVGALALTAFILTNQGSQQSSKTELTNPPITTMTAPTIADPTKTSHYQPAIKITQEIPIQTTVSPVDEMVMINIPAGYFIMGTDDGNIDARPAHEVFLDEYWIDQTEVTNGQYRKCVQSGFCELPVRWGTRTRNHYYGNELYHDFPVLNVNWEKANSYCQWAGRRLPTEAEWEKAARGIDGRQYPWGDDLPNENFLNFNNHMGDTTKVGSYPEGASPYGVMDMAGNVWEWVSDWHKSKYDVQTARENPTGPSTGQKRVVRGGSFRGYFDFYARGLSENTPLDWHIQFTGFRCASSISP